MYEYGRPWPASRHQAIDAIRRKGALGCFHRLHYILYIYIYYIYMYM